VQLVCDRAIVIFGGRVVAEIGGADADEPALLRAAYNLKSGAVIPELAAAEALAEAGPAPSPEPAETSAETTAPEGNR
jgi:ribose transport system ATP-binding protein